LTRPFGLGYAHGVQSRPALFYGLSTAAVLVLSGAVFGLEGIDPRSSPFLLSMPVAVLFLSHLGYTRRVEGRPLLRLVPYSAFLWFAAGTMEAVGIRSGLYLYEDTALSAFRLGPVPVLIPTIWMLLCWLAESISEFLFAFDRGRKESRAARCLASAWIMLSFALAMEWQLSRRIGLWSWADAHRGPRLDGVPLYNFLIWFAVGLAAPLLADLFRAPAIRYRTESRFVRSLPVIGFGWALLGGAVMNFSCGFPTAGAVTLGSLVVLAAILFRGARRRRLGP